MLSYYYYNKFILGQIHDGNTGGITGSDSNRQNRFLSGRIASPTLILDQPNTILVP